MAREKKTGAARVARRVMILAAALAALGATGAVAADWASWRGPNRNGVTPETLPAESWPAAGPKKLWSTGIGKSYAAVAVANGCVFAIGETGGTETVQCLDARTGATRWRYSHARGKREYQYDPYPTASTGTPVVAGDRVHVLTRDGLALCLGARDGNLQWERDLARETQNGIPLFGCGGSPVVVGDRVLYNLGQHGIALDAASGKVLWNSGPGMGGHATPVLLPGGTSAAILSGAGLVGVEVATGRQLWAHAWTQPGNIYAIDPVVAGDRIFVTGYTRGAQFRAGKALAEGYETRVLRGTFNNPVLVGQFLYGSDRGTLVCADWNSGGERWRHPGLPAALKEPARDRPSGPPPAEGGMIAAGKLLVLLDGGGTVHLIDATPEAYHERAQAHLIEGPCWTAPVLSNGILYCRNNEGMLAAFDLRAR